jgi:hypothetical protein
MYEDTGQEDIKILFQEKQTMEMMNIEHFINFINIRKSTGRGVGLFVVQKNNLPPTDL